MNILCMGDAHLRFLNPENRTDDFFATQYEKMEQVFTLAREYECKIIIQPGDLWDSPHPAKYVMAEYIKLFRQYSDIRFYTVLGQHDIAFRNFGEINRTASYLLQSAGVIQIVGLDEQPLICTPHLALHGMSYGQDYKPAPVANRLNILFAHASVGDRPLFPGHELESPRAYIAAHKGFDLIVLGDYHYTWQDECGGTQIIDAGCLVRKTTDQREREHKPCVFIFDLDTKHLTQIFLRVKPWGDVFRLPEKINTDDTRLLEFIEVLKSDRALSVSFVDNLRILYAKNMVEASVQQKIAHAMELAGMPKEELQCKT